MKIKIEVDVQPPSGFGTENSGKKEDPQTKKNIKVLKELRDSEETGDGVRIQVIQTLQKILDLVEGEVKPNQPTFESIFSEIRGGKT